MTITDEMVKRAAKPIIHFDLIIRHDGRLFLRQQPGDFETGPYKNVFEVSKVCRERGAALEAALSERKTGA